MPIRIEVLDDGKIRVFDVDGRRWSEYGNVPRALAAIAKILYQRIDKQRREQAVAFRVQ
jgi:predicted ATP-grasp superfamily ATP-dependent carboligase